MLKVLKFDQMESMVVSGNKEQAAGIVLGIDLAIGELERIGEKK